jgi:hypothetical protein
MLAFILRAAGRGPLHVGLLAGALLAGCSQDGGTTAMMDMVSPFPKDAIDIPSGPIVVPSGMERTVCVNAQLPLSVPVDVTQIATRQVSSHHVIFYKYVQGAMPVVNQTPQDCPPLDLLSGGSLREPLFIGESADQTQNVLNLPPGVAYHLEPTDYYRLEVHVVNASTNTLTANVDVFLTPAPPSTQVQYADMLFFNNTVGLDKSYDGMQSGLPPMTTTTIDPGFYTVRPDFKVFGLTTHEHHLGTGVTVSKSTSASDPGTPIFTNTDWQHPQLFRFPDAQPMTFATGEGLRWVCSYNNTSTTYVKFGESATKNEMCILWGYYYPSAGFQIYSN